MNDSLKQFKEEMEKRGFFRKIKVGANLIPPPPGLTPDKVIELQKSAAVDAILTYAGKHDDFGELMMEAALDHLLETVLTDDLFTPDSGFIPTAEEQASMERTESAAKMLTGLIGSLADILKHI